MANPDYLTLLKDSPTVTPLQASLQAFLLAKDGKTEKTKIHYAYTVGRFVEWLEAHDVKDVTQINRTHLRQYMADIKKIERFGHPIKDTTQHARMRGVKTWLRWLVKEEELTKSPFDGNVDMPSVENRVPAPFTPDDVEKLLATCDRKTSAGIRNFAILTTLLDTGLRCEEFCSLRIGDIDMKTGMGTVMGKGHKQRQFRVGAKARATIIKYLGCRGEINNGDPLWLTQRVNSTEDGPLTPHGLQTMLIRLGREAGAEPCGPHRFRRTFALWCLRDGMDLHSLRLLMGHSTLAVLQRYLALAGEDVERAHLAHSPMDNLLDKLKAGRRVEADETPKVVERAKPVAGKNGRSPGK
jgi:site-specific recombinase XerD